MRVHKLVIHHSGGPRRQTPAAIRRYHTAPKPRGKGWRDVGYHWLIDDRGETHVGREPHERGSHAPPNTGRLGVCVIGNNLDRNERWNPLQVQALRELVAACRVVWPDIKVVAHRDTKSTKCPGLGMDEIWDLIGLDKEAA